MGIVVLDCDECVLVWNAAAERILGRPRETVVGKITPISFKGGQDQECRLRRVDGCEIDVFCSVVPFPFDDGSVGKLATFADTTGPKKLQKSAEQRDRLEGFGVLAGGIAHEFNNLLTGVLVNAGLGLLCVAEESEVRTYLQEIVQTAERGGSVTRQLLAYVGKSRFGEANVNLNDLLRDIAADSPPPIAHPDIDVRLNLAPTLPTIQGDPGQLQQAIQALLRNAAESIDGVLGTITVSTRLETVRERAAGEAIAGDELKPGQYVILNIEDNGSGMEEDTLSRMFEPFFSTKFTGRGLGLSAAMGIVRQHGGTISAWSRPGEGSKFSVRLPAAGNDVSADATSGAASASAAVQ